MHTVERYHDISCGHRVAGHENKCRHLHGHNYRITFVCATEKLDPHLDELGRVIDFGVMKDLLCMWVENNWDHKMLLWDHDWQMRSLLLQTPIADDETAQIVGDSTVWVPFNPTAENMAQHLVEVVGPKQLQGTGVVLWGVKIEETRKCMASYFREDV